MKVTDTKKAIQEIIKAIGLAIIIPVGLFFAVSVIFLTILFSLQLSPDISQPIAAVALVLLALIGVSAIVLAIRAGIVCLRSMKRVLWPSIIGLLISLALIYSYSAGLIIFYSFRNFWNT
jgi:hypothetical protein